MLGFVGRVAEMYLVLAEEGRTDSWGGMESRRVLAELLSDPFYVDFDISDEELRDLIVKQANWIPPRDQEERV